MGPERIKNRAAKKTDKIKAHDAPASDMDMHPAFCFKYIDKQFCLDKCTSQEKAALASTISALSQQPWKTFFNVGRHGCGFEKINPQSIKRQIPEKAKGEKIIAFRFYDKAPMVGFKKGKIFYIIWLDRGFKLYNHS